MKIAPSINPPERICPTASWPRIRLITNTVPTKQTGVCHEITPRMRRYAKPMRSASALVSPRQPPWLPSSSVR